MEEKVLTPEVLSEKITTRLRDLDNATFLEKYAVFMGKAQIVEQELKGLLIRKYQFDEEDIDTRTLGWVIRKLKENNMRPDFISVLEDLLGHRNSLAHDFLSTIAMGVSIAVEGFQTLSNKELRHALFSVEKAIQIYGFLSEHGSFDINKSDT